MLNKNLICCSQTRKFRVETETTRICLGLIYLILMKLNKALIFKSGSIKSSDTVTITEEESGKC